MDVNKYTKNFEKEYNNVVTKYENLESKYEVAANKVQELMDQMHVDLNLCVDLIGKLKIELKIPKIPSLPKPPNFNLPDFHIVCVPKLPQVKDLIDLQVERE